MWPFARTPNPTEVAELRDRCIVAETQAEFMRARAEAGALFCAELIGTVAVLESQVQQLKRLTFRERRKDAGPIADAIHSRADAYRDRFKDISSEQRSAARSEALRRSVGRG